MILKLRAELCNLRRYIVINKTTQLSTFKATLQKQCPA